MPKVNNNGRLNQEQREANFNFDTEVSLIQAFIPIGIMAVEERNHSVSGRLFEK